VGDFVPVNFELTRKKMIKLGRNCPIRAVAQAKGHGCGRPNGQLFSSFGVWKGSGI
jgi:hypothetical protein